MSRKVMNKKICKPYPECWTKCSKGEEVVCPQTLREYPHYLTVEEAADILRISPRTMQQICRDGRIGWTRAGKRYLIPQESLDEYQKIRR